MVAHNLWAATTAVAATGKLLWKMLSAECKEWVSMLPHCGLDSIRPTVMKTGKCKGNEKKPGLVAQFLPIAILLAFIFGYKHFIYSPGQIYTVNFVWTSLAYSALYTYDIYRYRWWTTYFLTDAAFSSKEWSFLFYFLISTNYASDV